MSSESLNEQYELIKRKNSKEWEKRLTKGDQSKMGREAGEERERDRNGLILINNRAIIIWKKCNHTRKSIESCTRKCCARTHCAPQYEMDLKWIYYAASKFISFFGNSFGYIFLFLVRVLLLLDPPRSPAIRVKF